MASIASSSRDFFVVGNAASRADGSHEQIGDFFEGKQVSAVNVVVGRASGGEVFSTFVVLTPRLFRCLLFIPRHVEQHQQELLDRPEVFCPVRRHESEADESEEVVEVAEQYFTTVLSSIL